MNEKTDKPSNDEPEAASSPSSSDEQVVDDTDQATESENVAENETPTEKPIAIVSPDRRNPLQRLLGGYWHHKLWTLPLTLLVILAVLAGVPWTRYKLAGLALKQNYTVTVVDASTHQPISSASITIGAASAKTNNKGLATVRANVGQHPLTVSKKYYKTTSSEVLVPIMKQRSAMSISLQATGRQ